MALGNLDFEIAKKAIARHWQESTDYLLPAHIVSNSRRVKSETARDVRSAISRGLVTHAWPQSRPLGEAESKALEQHRKDHRGGITFDDGTWFASGEDMHEKRSRMAELAASTLKEIP